MLEKYKQEAYVKLPITGVRTIGELKLFIIENIKLSDDELFNEVRKYGPIGTDEKYLKSIIKPFKRKYKIDKLLNEKMSFKEFVNQENKELDEKNDI